MARTSASRGKKGYTPRSGKSPVFKMMGSSPARKPESGSTLLAFDKFCKDKYRSLYDSMIENGLMHTNTSSITNYIIKNLENKKIKEFQENWWAE